MRSAGDPQTGAARLWVHCVRSRSFSGRRSLDACLPRPLEGCAPGGRVGPGSELYESSRDCCVSEDWQRRIEAVRLYEGGLTLVEVGLTFGVSQQVVGGAMAAEGDEIRPRGRRPLFTR